jgi:hypothetical protein
MSKNNGSQGVDCCGLCILLYGVIFLSGCGIAYFLVRLVGG